MIGTMIWGHKTYDLFNGKVPPSKGVKNYVFSHTLREGVNKGVEVIKENAAEFVRVLKRQEGPGIFVMGGGELARSLIETDLIDEVSMNIHPILLGSGIALFHEMKNRFLSRSLSLRLDIELALLQAQSISTIKGIALQYK